LTESQYAMSQNHRFTLLTQLLSLLVYGTGLIGLSLLINLGCSPGKENLIILASGIGAIGLFGLVTTVRILSHRNIISLPDQELILGDADGQTMRVTGSTTDISERKQAEAALRQSEATARAKAAELEAFMEAVPAGVWIAHDPQCHHVTPNRAAYEMMRRSPNSVMTATPSDGQYPFQFKIQQNGQDVDPQNLPMQQAGRTGESVSGEFEFVFANGDVCSLYGKAVPVRYENGEIRGVIGAFLDITPRKQAEAALKQREEQLQLALKGAKQGIWDWDLRTQTLNWDDRCKEIFGLPPDFPVTYQWHISALHPDDRQRVMNAVTNALQNGDEFEQEYRTFWTDGTMHWILARGQCFCNAAGEPDRMSGTVADITSLKRDETIRQAAEASLQESQERLSLALDAARIGSWDWDVQSGAVVWSPYHEMIFGYQPGNPQRTYQEWCDRVYPDDLPVVELAIRQAMEEKREYSCDYRVVWTDGSIHWVSSYGRFHYDSNGQPTRMLGMLFDISDRKQTEAALQESELMFRTLADTMPQLFWVVRPDGYHEYCNQRWYHYAGLTLEQAHGEGVHQIMHPDDLPSTIQAFDKALAIGTMFATEHRLRRSTDGEYRWHLSQALPLRDQIGQVVKWFGSSTDIHDQKLLIEERAQALERERAARMELERANRMKDEFLAVVSHELRSPLNAILGWSRLLRTRKFDPQKTEQALASIERNAQAQTQLIEDLLDISRIIRGKIRLDLRPTNLILCVQAAIDTICPAATAKSIAITLHADSAMDFVLGDPERLQQVVWNLLSNAIKFTPMGGHIEVWVQANHQTTQIQVIDSGKGISPDFLPYVFERFRQEDATTTRTQGGLGLGLAIVRNLVELHGGSIHVHSLGEGHGTTFTVQFPLLPSALQGHPATNQGLHRQTIVDTPLDLTGVSVLTVDDEEDTREFLQAALEQYGAKVISAGSATEAWQFLQTHKPDVLLSDVGMPDEDGFTLMRRIRSLPSELGGQIPAAALTAYAREGDRLEALAAGFHMHIPKPIEPIQLLTVIMRLLERQKEFIS
jgi:PAS domain S-box-containing protein